MRILLIEDNEFISFLYKRQLEKSGFVTDTAATGKDGLDAIAKNEYDFILLDMLLPDMNGINILTQVKSNEKTKHIAVLLISNLGQASIMEEAKNLGAVGYLIKDQYSPDEIVEKVKFFLRSDNASKTDQQQS